MMLHRAVHGVIRAISWLAPRSEREAMMGDLAEEYVLRANAVSASAACKWYLRQVCASAAPLLWARLTRTAWMSTVGVALFAYIVIGVVEFIVNGAIASLSATTTAAYNPLGMFMTFPMVVVIGYFAARFRRAATVVLASLMLLSVTAMTLWGNESLPIWYRSAYFVVGPAATFIGSALNSHRPAGC
jgi:hypothetical protein